MSSALQTDLYQVTMAYAYWKAGKQDNIASFEVFFRKCPFKGEYAIFGGLQECIYYIENFKFKPDEIDYLKGLLPEDTDKEFFDYLLSIDASSLTVYAIEEGSVCFPRIPLMMLNGPLIICQLLETAILNFINFASLVCTNAVRHRVIAGPDIKLFEFGMRRAQGPNGAMTASKYAYLGGFDATSNLLAGKTYGIPVIGTHAHSFVSSFTSYQVTNPPIVVEKIYELKEARIILAEALKKVPVRPNDIQKLYSKAKSWLGLISNIFSFKLDQVHSGELEAFVHYAFSFPNNFLALVDTYNTLNSGVENFIAVALSLAEFGYKALGIRIDSGDLAYQSLKIREKFKIIASELQIPFIENLMIVASNDLDEKTIRSIKQQGHSIDAFAVGTNLVTCSDQPAMGCVYKLVEIDSKPTVKLTANISKASLPGRKKVYRLISKSGLALADVMQLPNEPAPQAGQRTLIRHVIEEHKRVFIVPLEVIELHQVVWSNNKSLLDSKNSLSELRIKIIENISKIREDHLRALNPTPYKVSVSDSMFKLIHNTWFNSAPIMEIS